MVIFLDIVILFYEQIKTFSNKVVFMFISSSLM